MAGLGYLDRLLGGKSLAKATKKHGQKGKKLAKKFGLKGKKKKEFKSLFEKAHRSSDEIEDLLESSKKRFSKKGKPEKAEAIKKYLKDRSAQRKHSRSAGKLAAEQKKTFTKKMVGATGLGAGAYYGHQALKDRVGKRLEEGEY